MPIRKRPISFGNPALGTYKGFVYTLEDDNDRQKYTVPDAQAVERMVAMVDVPPEQVPEGILHLARSHRPYIEHVRIVIAEPHEEQTGDNYHDNDDQEAIDKDHIVPSSSPQIMIPSSISAIESAASILAAESRVVPDLPPKQSLKWSISDMDERPQRSYLVLFHLFTEKDAETMVQDLHGRPYTSLDETVTCSVHTVVGLEGEGGVSLLNPMFAPSTKKTHGTVEILPSPSSGDEDSKNIHATANNNHHLTEDPNCAVCLEHMSLNPGQDDHTSILTTVCNHTFHLDCLVQCQDSPCPVCRYDHAGLNETLSQCHICGTTERNYVCLICGVVSCVSGTVVTTPSLGVLRDNDSCGPARTRTASLRTPSTYIESSEVTAQRFYTSHANQHYDETLHAYALDTETQHVWDFAGQGYVHRLLQNKEDGKLVEVSDPNNTTSQERSMTPGLSDTQEGEVVHRKLEGFASQYYTLLKSQLEQQRTFYEGRLEEIRREFAMKKVSAIHDKADLTSVLKQEKKQLAQRLLSLKRKKEKIADDVAFLKSMNESLQANKTPLERKIKQAQREQIESREMLQKCLPTLEEKVTTLMLQLEGSLNVDDEDRIPPADECAPNSST